MLKVNNVILKDGCAETFSRLLDKGCGAIYCPRASILHQFSVNLSTDTRI